MKIEIRETRVICNNPDNPKNGYFGWPSVERLKNGRLAMVASGFRMAHVCPFGKGIICYSENEGKTWTRPAVVIDTPLDDRDCGILAFDESSVMITSFNNKIETQRGWNSERKDPYIEGYLDTVDAEKAEERFLGSTFVISEDNGVTFGPVKRIPISSPHGPCLNENGEILYVGCQFFCKDSGNEEDTLALCKVNRDGSYELMSTIANVASELLNCEPHAIVMPDGKIIVHIRVQGRYEDKNYFTTYQSESTDGGKSFSEPHRILELTGGAPAHLLLLRDGTLISTYGYRNAPYGIRMMYSKDGGETWNTNNVLYDEGQSGDLGYPASVQLDNDDILTVFYENIDGISVIKQIIWNFIEE